MDSKNGIIGLAIGDAMGVPLEFCARQKLMQSPTTEMLGYGSHNVLKGSWSDDTSMTLATLHSIIEKGKIDTNDMADKFLKWFRNSEYTPDNETFDIGRTTLQALAKYELKLDNASNCGGFSEYDNGNGSLMRILPVTYYCYSKKLTEQEIYEIVKKVSSITHRHEISIMGCFIYVIFGMELLNSKNLTQAYKKVRKIKYDKYFSRDTIRRYERILKDNINKYSLDEIKSSGFVVDTLEATLWVLLNTNSYNQAIIGAINLGDDTDTVGACVGGLAGIYYGQDSINQNWKNDLLKFNYINNLCDKFNKVLNKI